VLIKGVNLGNWLVLEKWMSPALFEGTEAEDEYYLPRQLSPEVYQARIQVHRSEYISERDFASIQHMGLNAVRIPVPYFVFGDRPPFIGCVKELDKAFSWAEKYGIKILIDLHTAPMSQNGFDNGGISGVCRWSQLPDEVEFVLNVLERLAQRYGQRTGLLGITPINEPITEEIWQVMDISNRYPPVDKELAAGSAPNTVEFLYEFYNRAFDRMIPHLKEDAVVVFHDGFVLDAWKELVTQPRMKGRVMLDTHQYLMTAEAMGCPQTVEGYLDYIQEHYAKKLAEVQKYVPVVCGEWCLFNSLAVGMDTKGGQSVLNGMDFEDSKSLSEEEKTAIYNQLAEAQLSAWKNGSGYFYWNYKLLLDTVNEPNWQGWDCWDMEKSFHLGWIPQQTL
jgi:aryl-phospho-beta-D-glucosidase BglC (GH1 family)